MAGAVTLAHVALFLMLARIASPPIEPPLPPIMVELVEPAPPEPDPPDPEPSPRSGGGAPAAPSRVHVPPDPPRIIPEVIAPIEQAPEPDPIAVGVAPIASPTPGRGLGGQGTGTGAGVGSGSGPGSGTRTPPRLVREPSIAEIGRYVPPGARATRTYGDVSLRCTVRLDTRVENCRIVRETPAGYGFGEAAREVAQNEYRFRPPTLNGQIDTNFSVGIDIRFGPPAN